jgi:2-oxo-4-hydroxy-4-carboxy--5-ureidoimidazoline (OHCU) decarboxylase
MKNLNELTLEEIKTRFHQLQSKRNWHSKRTWCREDSEKKCEELAKEIKRIVTFLQNKVQVINLINRAK